MKEKKALKIIFILSVISLFLPWFTFNAKVMGYCWGWQFLSWFVIPVVIIAAYLFASKKSMILQVLAEVGTFVNLVSLVIAFGKWEEKKNINTGFQWNDGLHTAQIGFWISAVLFLTFFVLFQYDLFKKKS